MTRKKLNLFSSKITQPKSQGASQAMLHATGLSKEDMAKPQVGISSMWYEGNPCNMHLLDLANIIKESVNDSGLIGFRFNTIGVSDGISMGTSGMSFSLQSRDLIADSIETVMGGQWYDANVSIPGCDKNMPGCLMAMGRFNRPSIMVYGGTIRSGKNQNGEPLDIVSAFQSYGAYLSGDINEEQRSEIVQKACPGAGACGGMYTANTMAAAAEALGMSLPYSSSSPATSEQKTEECRNIGAAISKIIEKDIKPKDVMTEESFFNAMTVVSALGGSTNAVLHLIAIAKSVDIRISLNDFQEVSNRVPFLADLKPSGTYLMEDLHSIGGTPAILKYLLENKLINGDTITVTGNSLGDNLEKAPGLPNDQKVINNGAKMVSKIMSNCIQNYMSEMLTKINTKKNAAAKNMKNKDVEP